MDWNFRIQQKQKTKKFKEKNKTKRDTLKSLYALYEDREMVLNPFKTGTFTLPPIESTRPSSDFASRLRILIPKKYF